MNLGDLEKTLQQKLEQDKQRAEAISKKNEQQFQQNSQKIFKNAENTIKVATDQITHQVLIWSSWMAYLPAATILILLAGIFGGSWGMSRYLTQLYQEIQTQEQNLILLQKKSWGVELYQNHQGKFIILPPNTSIKTNWKCQEKPCLKL